MTSRNGSDLFASYYRDLYADRWPALEEALRADPCYVTIEYPGRPAYFLDEASFVAAKAAGAASGADILDACAAWTKDPT